MKINDKVTLDSILIANDKILYKHINWNKIYTIEDIAISEKNKFKLIYIRNDLGRGQWINSIFFGDAILF